MKSLLVKLGVLFIGLLILGNAEVCGAEGIWVLWTRTTTTGRPSAPVAYESWDIINGFPSFKQCKEALELECKDRAYAHRMDDLSNDCPGGIVFIRKGIEWMIYFKCLPDTIDPRK
ncbi:MAG: hypothetical protein ABSH06_14385 [Thermodesulfobacteriota bacterium]|jgi:hypothetical protein